MTSPTYAAPHKLEIYHKYKLVLRDRGISGDITATFLGFGDHAPNHWELDLIFNIGKFHNYNLIKFEDLGIDQNYYPPKSFTRKRKKK